jgi:lysophospholipid acyltransferase (LPLAT)-like uncharacterized protein
MPKRKKVSISRLIHYNFTMLYILNRLIYLTTIFFNSTYRYRYIGNEHLIELNQKKQNFILSIWHQTLLPGILAQTGHPFIVIISKSKDAEVVAYTCTKLGHLCVRGSSKRNGVNKNGQEAKQGMIDKLKEGYPGAVTVDGPKGPCFKVKPGIVDMALQSKSVIVPYTIHPEKFWQFNSWDKFKLPKPFSTIYVIYGKPFEVDENRFDQEVKRLEEVMINEMENSYKRITSCKTPGIYNWWKKIT